jgi:molybdenum cofactor biosynthesis enzyme MoaA
MDIMGELPSSICLRVTRNCNVACSFCQAPPKNRAELTVDEIGEMARFFAIKGVRSMKLSGGEPTVRDDLWKIIGAVAEVGIKSVVITNGFAVPDRLINVLAEYGGEFKFSIHRPSAKNDEVLGRKSFTEIRKNIDKVIERGVRLSINSVVTPANAASMRDMVDFACAVGAGKISFIPVVARGRAKMHDVFEFGPDELARVHESIVHLASLYEGKIVVRCIDIRSHDYWIVENDGSLWIERATEVDDVKICDKDRLLSGT